MTEAAINQAFQDSIKSACEKFYETFPEELADLERITKFVSLLTFDLDQSPDEIVEETMKKNLHTLLYEDHALVKLRKRWGALMQAKTDKQNKSSFSFGVGDAAPETKKNQMNFQILTKNSKQVELMQSNLGALEPNPEYPLIALKIFTSKAEEVKAFADQMMEMFGAEQIFQTLPIEPEVRFVAAEDHLIVEVTAKKSLELTFMTFLVRAFLSKLPEHDVEIDLNFLLGTNFADLINNHTDNTVNDVLNGLRINIEFKNNLKGFMEEFVSYFFNKATFSELDTWETKKVMKHAFISKVFSFLFGGASLNTNLSLNLGANEAALMSKIPAINIFDKEGILSKTPIGQAKMMMDSNEMSAPVIDLLNTMEGKGELYFFSPILGAYGDIDFSGIMDLAMHVINLFSESE